jgi:regulation of enolase protein 1 (concanavalin A-like superfamily)
MFAHTRPHLLALLSLLSAATLLAACLDVPADEGEIEQQSHALVGAWSAQDIGAVGTIGNWSEANGTHTVRGAGADIYGTADAFRFVYQDVSGDVTITARVQSLENKNTWTKAAVMIRQDLTAGAKNVATVVSPTASNKFRQQVRSASNGSSTTASSAASSAIPIWLRLERAGSSFKSYHSSDGNTWTLIATSTVSMSGTVRVGLAVASHVAGTLATAVFTNVSFTTPPPPSPPAAPTGLVATPGSNQVSLSWTASASATSYTVKYGTTAGSYDVANAGIAATSFIVTGLATDVAYHFVVSASNSAGESGNSAEVTATPVMPVAAQSLECQRWQTAALTRVAPTTTAELNAALAGATPGTMIELAAGTTYTATGTPARFSIVGRNGTAASKIILCGPRSAVLASVILSDAADDGGTTTNYGLWLSNSSYWIVDGFTVRTTNKGVVLDGSSNNSIRYLWVNDLGEEAIHLRRSSSANVVEYNLIEDTGKRVPGFGEAIYIGTAAGNWLKVMGALVPDRSDNNTVRFNTTRSRSEGVDVKEGTTGGLIEGNTIYGTYLAGSGEVSADSCMELKGKGYSIKSNVCETTLVDGLQVKNQSSACQSAGTTCADSGSNNILELNRTNMRTPSGGTATGYAINVGSNTTGTVVKCNNTLTNKAASFLSNKTCTN